MTVPALELTQFTVTEPAPGYWSGRGAGQVRRRRGPANRLLRLRRPCSGKTPSQPHHVARSGRVRESSETAAQLAAGPGFLPASRLWVMTLCHPGRGRR